jgi:predicted DNA-binding transcriptional regulator AlpA
LSIKADKLRKLIKEDNTFPRPIKEGNTRQAAVYFDMNAIEEWWDNKLTNSVQLI